MRPSQANNISYSNGVTGQYDYNAVGIHVGLENRASCQAFLFGLL